MDLKDALKDIVTQYGRDIILDNKLLHILNDYKAFESLPGSKFIMKTLISEGYLTSFISVKGDNNAGRRLYDKIINETGLDEEKTIKVMQALSDGLDLSLNLTSVNSQNSNHNKKKQSITNIYSIDKIIWNYRTEDERLFDYWNKVPQNNLSHNDFKGIAINGNAIDFMKQLTGETTINKTGRFLVYKTRFAGIDNCEIVVLESEYTGNVYAVYVLTPKKRIWDDIDVEFKSLKEGLTNKYSKPDDWCFDYDESNSFYTSLRRNLLDWKSYYYLQNGIVVLSIDSTERNLLVYYDRENYIKHKEARDKDISQSQHNDL